MRVKVAGTTQHTAMSSMYREYQSLYEKYSALYGQKTAIFLQVGSFYELYDTINPLTSETACNCREIVDHIGIQMVYKKGDGVGGADGLFAGIPDQSLHKWAGRLTDAGWTVVVVDQVKDAAGRVLRREVTRILSPGTHIENATNTADAPAIACIWLAAGATAPPEAAAAVLDLTTGMTETMTAHVRGDAAAWSSDQLIQFLQVHSPRELLVAWRGDALLVPEEAALRRKLAYSGGLMHIRLAQPEYQGALESPLTREEYLRGIYGIRSLLPTREYLHLAAAPDAERALTSLLRFVEDHMPSALTHLQRNRQWSPKSALVLGNHALTQLQISAPRVQDSVLGLYKSCITPMGKRAIRERILSPSADAAHIRARLAEVTAAVGINATATEKAILFALRNIADLPRIHRRLVCAMPTATDIYALDASYKAAEVIQSTAGIPHEMCAPAGLMERLVDWRRATFDRYFSVKKALAITEDTTFLNASAEQFPLVAELEAKLVEIRESVEKFVELCGSVAGRSKDSGGFRIEERDKQPYGVRGTRAALQVLQAALKSPLAPQSLVNALHGAEISIQKGGGWVDVPWLATTNAEVVKLRGMLAAEVARIMPEVCAEIAGDAPWTELEAWLEMVDVTQCIARESVARGFSCPSVTSEPTGASSLEVRGLRHPLIETILTRTEYVQHDVELGTAADNAAWLVYGMNASGKSSLMKSIGIAVHLAQAGCYVPASSCKLVPFKAIYTRILNQDNLWAGLSSFAVEMAEMRDILESADERTLVLGDELCSGTESVSAQALVAAGIEWLSARRSRYVFATHLHGLLSVLPDPQSLGLKVWHLKVVYDAAADRLIYERTLKPGAGSTLYGIEVARAMHLPVAYIEVAQKYRRRIQGAQSYEESVGSDWNREICRRLCEVCGHNIVSDLEVHHIRPRMEAVADSKRFEDGSGRDDVRNLVVVCEKCHDAAHAGKVEIGVVKQTSDGPVRVGSQVVDTVSSGSQPPREANPFQASKWTPEEQETIFKMLRMNQIVPLKQLAFRLRLEEGIEISESTLRKVRAAGTF